MLRFVHVLTSLSATVFSCSSPPRLHIVVQSLGDNVLQEDTFHEGNVLHLADQIRIHDEGGSDFPGVS